MDQIVPDEVHIERLFPKCAPNYSQAQRRKTRSKKHHRRVRSKRSSIHIGNLAPESLLNDTSSEELCSNNNISPANTSNNSLTCHTIIRQDPSAGHDNNRLSDLPTVAGSPSANNSRAVNGSGPVNEGPIIRNQTREPEEQPAEEMLTDNPGSARGSLMPPGFAQRIRFVPDPQIDDGNSIGPETLSTKLDTTSKAEEDIERSSRLPQETIAPHFRTEGQRVTFNEENLVSVEGVSNPPANLLKVIDNIAAVHTITSRHEYSPLMPIIKEDQDETESEDVLSERLDNQLSESLEKSQSLDQGISDDHLPLTQAVESSESTRLKLSIESHSSNPQSSLPRLNNDQQYLPDQLMDIKVSPGIELRVEETDNSQQSYLRHHRLPNESSHYSLLRASHDTAQDVESPRFSNLQFNSLSEVESEADDSPAPINPKPSKSIYHSPASDHHTQSSIHTQDSQSANNRSNPTALLANGSHDGDPSRVAASSMHLKRAAVVFPCLDDGLSSDPESCDGVAEDDDEHAMDADVEADDDEEEDDDADAEEDIENTLKSLNRLAIQTSMSNFTPQQQRQRQHRHAVRSTSSRLEQRSETHFGTNLESDDSAVNQSKDPASAHFSLNQQQASGAKLSLNYPNQNSHWSAAANQTTGPINRNSSSQPAFNNQRSSQIHCADIKDEVKTINRLSSDTDNETDRLLGSQRNDQQKLAGHETNSNNDISSQPVISPLKQNANSKEVLIEGVLFNVKYLGSTHNECEGRSEKEDRILQAEMAVKEVKFRNGSTQAAVEVQLFISTEKIMVLDDKHRKIMMDHSLRTISYIADIGDAIVLIVKKKSSTSDATNELGRALTKISCHVFESSESHTITKSISQAFQVAYAEIIKANGSSESGNYLPRELDYQEVLNAQEMSTTEIDMFLKSQREVIVPKDENEILGISIVESGWGSVLPDVVISSLKHDGPAYRCKRLSISDHILTVNGISLVGKPLIECQQILHKTRKQRVARLSIVPGSITVEVKIKRPDTKYQLGFSVQNGVICSLLRGGIAERGGVRVGHRIMSINGTTVVGVPHEKIVSLLASSVGEIRMKTCLTTIYRHMTGEEKPVHV